MFLRNSWYAAGWSRDFAPATLTPIKILNEPIVVYRQGDGQLVALQDRCCHRFFPLSNGRLEGENLRCMYHGLKFAPSGKCIEIPGQEKIPPQAAVRKFPIADEHSVAWVWLGDAQRADPARIPSFVGVDDPRWAMKPGRMNYEANYVLINDNLLDLTHIGYVHSKTLGAAFGAGGAFREIRPKVTRIDGGLRVDRWIVDLPPPPELKVSDEAVSELWTTYDFLVPGIFILRAEIHRSGTAAACNGGPPTAEPLHAQFTCQAVTPVSERETFYLFAYGPWARQSEFADAFYELGRTAFNEDRVTVEAQQRAIDAAPGAKMLTISFDSAVSQFRRMMDDLIRAEAQGDDPVAAAAAV